ncbi:MAG: hypothetical protein PHY40_01755 [Patescibacteria group bacterium]|nr:hypothetical protein [Patescibacteria group bacterium]
MIMKMNKIKIYCFIASLLSCCFFVQARAADFASQNFISREPVFGDFGGRSDSASFGQINSGGQTITGESSSSNFILRSGFLYFENKVFTPRSQNWKWFDDEENETPALELAGENTAPADIAEQNTVKLRLSIKEIGNTKGKNMKFRLQFSKFSDFTQEVYNVAEIGDCDSNSVWCYADGAGDDNVLITTKLLSDSDNCSGGVGVGCGAHNESGISESVFTHLAKKTVEYEFTVKSSGAEENTAYFFRAFDTVNGKPVSVNFGKSYPSLSIGGAKFVFSVSGLSGGISSEGITTDVPTTPATISFGSLNFDSEIEAAQRLSVSTNAKGGYSIFVLQRQGLLGPVEIPPVDAVNETPNAWYVKPGKSGAYGYHTGDDTLFGESARFAPDNTYAKFENSPKEIIYSSGPVNNESTDMVFKVQVSNQQEAGEYASSIIYIAVPIF